MQHLIDPAYLSFPFRFKIEERPDVDGKVAPNRHVVVGAAISQRKEHVAEQIEQVLFTDPRERVFRPNFGGGLRTLVFEPNVEALRSVVRERLTVALSEVLKGEIDLASLSIDFLEGQANSLILVVSYRLVAIDQLESHQISLGFLNG